MKIIEGIKRLFDGSKEEEEEDKKRLTLISDLLQEKIQLRARLDLAVKRGKAVGQMAESWRRQCQEAKSETNVLRKRKTYYKKRCSFLEADIIRIKDVKAVDIADQAD